jgi:hypothetical protein
MKIKMMIKMANNKKRLMMKIIHLFINLKFSVSKMQRHNRKKERSKKSKTRNKPLKRSSKSGKNASSS